MPFGNPHPYDRFLTTRNQSASGPVQFREYGFSADFCHTCGPQSKAIVENLCGYAQSDLVVPLLTEVAMTGQPVDLQAANAAAAATWCAEVHAAVHSEICTVPNERVARETNLSDDWCS